MSSKTKSRFTSRTRARKRAVDTLFEAEQRDLGTPGAIRDLLQQRQRLTAAQSPLPEYAIEIVEGVADHLGTIEDLLAQYSTSRPFDRLPSVDRAVLRVGAWEILWNDVVPDVTAIDEAVTIVKEVSTEESPSVVNAMLDAIRKNAAEALQADAALAAAFDAPSEASYSNEEEPVCGGEDAVTAEDEPALAGEADASGGEGPVQGDTADFREDPESDGESSGSEWHW